MSTGTNSELSPVTGRKLLLALPPKLKFGVRGSRGVGPQVSEVVNLVRVFELIRGDDPRRWPPSVKVSAKWSDFWRQVCSVRLSSRHGRRSRVEFRRRHATSENPSLTQ